MNNIYWRWAVINNLNMTPTLKHLLLAILFYQRDKSRCRGVTSNDLAADLGVTYRNVNVGIRALAAMGINVRVAGGFEIDFAVLDGWVQPEVSGE